MTPGILDDEFLKDIQNDFYEDLTEKLILINQKMILMEKEGIDNPSLREVYRLLHNIKGTSATLGFPEISIVAHKAEDFLSLLIDHSVDLNGKNLAEFFSMMDNIEKLRNLYRNNSSKEEIRDFFQGNVLEQNKKTKLILLVENSKSIRKYIKKGLTQEGFQVIEAPDSLGALIRAVTEPIDYLITSKEQAIIDGINLIKMVKANNTKGHVKTVLITTEESGPPCINKIIFKDKDLLSNIIQYLRNES